MGTEERRPRGRPRHPDILTPAEWRTVHAVQHGMTSRQIARRRSIRVDAVKFHVTNALAKLGLESRRALRDWFAVPRHSALHREKENPMTPSAENAHASVAKSLALGPIGQISRSVGDIDRARAWYGDVLGLPHLYTFGKLSFFDCGGTRLFLTAENEPGAESVIYLRVPDIEEAYQELERRGVRFTSPPHMIYRHDDGTEEWMAFFEDPEARPLALMTQVRA